MCDYFDFHAHRSTLLRLKADGCDSRDSRFQLTFVSLRTVALPQEGDIESVSEFRIFLRTVNARESIRVTGRNIDWIYPGRNELTSYTIDQTNLLPQSSSGISRV